MTIPPIPPGGSKIPEPAENPNQQIKKDLQELQTLIKELQQAEKENDKKKIEQLAKKIQEMAQDLSQISNYAPLSLHEKQALQDLAQSLQDTSQLSSGKLHLFAEQIQQILQEIPPK